MGASTAGGSLTALTAAERETNINLSDASDSVDICTAQRKVITALRKRPGTFTEVASGFYGSTEWARFTTSLTAWSVATGAKRKGTPRPSLRALNSSSVTGTAGAP